MSGSNYGNTDCSKAKIKCNIQFLPAKVSIAVLDKYSNSFLSFQTKDIQSAKTPPLHPSATNMLHHFDTNTTAMTGMTDFSNNKQ